LQTEEIRSNLEFAGVGEVVTEWEEDRVSEWEVLTRNHSASPPSTPLPFNGEQLRLVSHVRILEEFLE
jgi:hypothetical protein